MANNFGRSIEDKVVVSSIATTAGYMPRDLAPLQLGIFDGDTYVLSPSALPVNILLAVGSPHIGEQSVGGLLGNFANVNQINVSYKSGIFRAADVVQIDHQKAVTVTKHQISYLGYDGITLCKGIFFQCGKTYDLALDLSGQPVQQITGRADYTEIFSVKTDDCAVCPSGCLSNDQQVKYLNTLCSEINTNSVLSNRYIKASPVVKYCTPPPTIPKVWYAKFQVSACDGGDVAALATVKRQTTNKTKKLNDTSGIPVAGTTTYESDWVLIPAVAGTTPTALEIAAATPAAYVVGGFTLQNCSTCPAGSTSVAGGLSYLITIANAGSGTNAAAWLAEVQTAYPTAVAAIREDYSNATSSYVVTFPSAFVPPAVTPASTTNSYLGVVTPYCVLASSSYAWTSVDTAYKIVRKLTSTITNSDCIPDTTTLGLIQAYYLNDTTIVPASIIVSTPPMANSSVASGTDGCKTIYEVQQYSNILQDGCDWTALASYPALAAFKGFVWEVDLCKGWTLSGTGCPVPPVAQQDDVTMGIRFDVTFFSAIPQGAAYSVFDQENKEPIAVFASLNEAYVVPYGKITDLGISYRITQNYQKENLKGHTVLQDLVLSGLYKNEFYHDQEYKLQASQGWRRAVDPNRFYNYVKIVYDINPRTNNLDSGGFRRSFYFYYDTTDVVTGNAIVALINKIGLKNGNIKLIA